MARPKLDDPTVPIAFRMKRSAAEWWAARAEKEATTLPKLLRRLCEEKADSQSPPSTHTSDGSPESTKSGAGK